jgi:hypothetical protein
MHQKAIGYAAIAALVAACATGTAAPGRDGGVVHPDAAPGNDGSTNQDGSGPQDSGPPKESGTPLQDGSTCNLTICGNLCVDTSTDDSNCGTCNNACTGGSSCSNSQCQCSGGLTYCSGSCVDTTMDNSNCGACNNPCGTNETCTNSVCQTNVGGAPPQGSCAHGLCDANLGYLDFGCDPNGCVDNVCNADLYCCDTDWDDICVGEVATYCSPYSCP